MSVFDTMSLESLELLQAWLEDSREDELDILEGFEEQKRVAAAKQQDHLIVLIECLQVGIEQAMSRKAVVKV